MDAERLSPIRAVALAATLALGCAGATSSDEASEARARVAACVARAPGAACEIDPDDDIDEVNARFGVCVVAANAGDDGGEMACQLDGAALVRQGGE